MVFSVESDQQKYPFILPELPFDTSQFGDFFSQETFNYHHGKHHAAYVNNLNKLLENKPELQQKTLEELILLSFNNQELVGIYNNAAQIWNHSFFWQCMTPGKQNLDDQLLNIINNQYGSFDDFCKKFSEIAISQFGSGWAWLVKKEDGKLDIIKTSNADTPIVNGLQPILTCDVWEHAYYIDYKNQRQLYVDMFLKNLVNWRFVEKNFNK